ncbi:hypothetical protein [Staphylococcus caprae]|uniref:hypothetical protein n=1 Tax=Staphylococcus caprae TaxID=29380 RepID=UPI0014524942|nr:hypothetical protein [Staphylococcus caprae]QJE26642.1 hypothetical protein HHJ99_12795 [Staphylococcus caprae]
MTEFHYRESKDLTDLNMFQKIIETGQTWEYITMILFVILGISMMMVSWFYARKKGKDLDVMFFLGIFITVIGSLFIVIYYNLMSSTLQSTGYYEAKTQVSKVDKDLDENDNLRYAYHFDTKEDEHHPLRVPLIKTSDDSLGLKKGDKVIVRTPIMNFKGTEKKTVDSGDIMDYNTDINKNIVNAPTDSESEGVVPKSVTPDDLIVHKQ